MEKGWPDSMNSAQGTKKTIEKRSVVIITTDEKIITGNLPVQQRTTMVENWSITALLNNAGITHPESRDVGIRRTHSNAHVHLYDFKMYLPGADGSVYDGSAGLFIPVSEVFFAFGNKEDYTHTPRKTGPMNFTSETVKFIHGYYWIDGVVSEFEKSMSTAKKDELFISVREAELNQWVAAKDRNLVERLAQMGLGAADNFFTVNKSLMFYRNTY